MGGEGWRRVPEPDREWVFVSGSTLVLCSCLPTVTGLAVWGAASEVLSLTLGVSALNKSSAVFLTLKPSLCARSACCALPQTETFCTVYKNLPLSEMASRFNNCGSKTSGVPLFT